MKIKKPAITNKNNKIILTNIPKTLIKNTKIKNLY